MALLSIMLWTFKLILEFLGLWLFGIFFPRSGWIIFYIWSPCGRKTVLTFWIFSIGTQLLFSNLSFHLSVSFMALLSLMIWTFKIILALLGLWLFGLLFPRIGSIIFPNILVTLQQTDGFNFLNIFDRRLTTLFKSVLLPVCFFYGIVMALWHYALDFQTNFGISWLVAVWAIFSKNWVNYFPQSFGSPCVRQMVLTFWIFSIVAQLLFSKTVLLPICFFYGIVIHYALDFQINFGISWLATVWAIFSKNWVNYFSRYFGHPAADRQI